MKNLRITVLAAVLAGTTSLTVFHSTPAARAQEKVPSRQYVVGVSGMT